MGGFTEDLNHKGYNQEELYFAHHNRELIDNMKREVTEEAMRKEPWYMTCPKCGGKLHEVKMEGIAVDKCTSCHGVYFDNGELEALTATQEPKGMLDTLRNLFVQRWISDRDRHRPEAT